MAPSAHELAIHVDGDGPPVLLLHAEGLDSRMGDPQVGALAPGCRAIRVDERGHGGSSRTPGEHRPVDEVFQVLADLEDGPAAVVGSLSGARQALELAPRAPASVSALVLVNAVVGLTAGEVAMEAALEVDEDLLARREYARGDEHDGRPDDELMVELALASGWLPTGLDPAAEHRVRTMVRDNLAVYTDPPAVAWRPLGPEQLASIEVPVLVMVHADEAARREAQALADALPHAQLATFGAEASVVNLEVPDEFNLVLLDFLDRVRAAPPGAAPG